MSDKQHKDQIHQSPKVCIIGGGPTGIGIGREMLDAGFEFDLFESESDFGGVWNSQGECSRAYPSLHLISPKFNTQVPDFPMPEEFPHYPNHRQMLEYIRSYAKKFGLYERAHFNARVVSLTQVGNTWRTTVEEHNPTQLSHGNQRQYSYDFVIVCNGLQRIARYPDPPYPGQFSGTILHAKDYKSTEQIKGKRVLCIGAGNSGCDIAVDACHHADKIYHSTRRGYYYQPKFINGKPTPQWMMELGNKFDTKEESLAYIKQVFKMAGFDGADYGLKSPDYPLDACHPIMNSQILYHIGHGDVCPKGDVKYFDGNKVFFEDNSSVEVDIVIYATGYKRDLSFLDPGILKWKNEIPDLFLHSTPKNLENMLFMGFINAAGGLGDGLKTQGKFVVSYLRAFITKSAGYKKFMEAKNNDTPDIGQGYFVESYRHQWEADLWKLLGEMRKYRSMLEEV